MGRTLLNWLLLDELELVAYEKQIPQKVPPRGRRIAFRCLDLSLDSTERLAAAIMVERDNLM